ncbi:nitroreductase [Robbsia andropogonis]|uniref:nitroreductase n=2 Tax=Robbsia andropogonis TaxID=28092 RepID=UPI0004679DBF|nr:nitroreductase [Robbsia andropogonis]
MTERRVMQTAVAFETSDSLSTGMRAISTPETHDSRTPCDLSAADGAFAIDADHPLVTRRSTRQFLSTPLPDGMLAHLLRVARQAPSGANLQPGEIIHVRGAARARLSAALCEAHRAGRQEVEDYRYFPNPMPHTLRRRQVAAAQALYQALGVARDDSDGRAKQFTRNFQFFDAPVALLVTIDSRLGAGGYMDLGMMLHGLMVAAQAEGLGSCAIGAMAHFPRVIRASLGLTDSRHVVCGMALGYRDPAAPVNACRTARMPLADFFTEIG